MSWDYKILNELGTVSRGRSRHRPRNDNSLFGGKYPFVQTADVKAANFYLTDYTETYNEKGLEQSRLWKAGTLCITIAANIADTAILGIDACFPDSIMGFVPFEGVSNAKFIKYAFDMLQRDIKQISQGTAQDNLSWQKLEMIKFPAPDIKIQNKIVEILGTFDDLIENNQKRIKILEEAAQRLYKEWFADLRFPGYENCKIVDGVPEGWSKARESKKQFMTYGNELNRMMKYLDRDDISKADRERKDAIIAIVDELKKKKKHVDNTDLMVQINGILGDYIMIERAANDRGFAKRFDISKIDFDLLRREFAKVKKKNLAFMDLDELIQVRLDAMIRENPRRVDYYIRYQQIIEEYNSEQDRVNIEKTFMELMDLANSMNEEEQRYVREGFGSDEELSMYDMLFDENLSKEDIKKIKKVAVDLLDKIKTKISELDHWTDKQETKAEVDNLIGKILWEELPESYSDSAIFEYRKLIFEYVFMRYKQVA